MRATTKNYALNKNRVKVDFSQQKRLGVLNGEDPRKKYTGPLLKLLAITMAFAFAGCGGTRALKTLGKGDQALGSPPGNQPQSDNPTALSTTTSTCSIPFEVQVELLTPTPLFVETEISFRIIPTFCSSYVFRLEGDSATAFSSTYITKRKYSIPGSYDAIFVVRAYKAETSTSPLYSASRTVSISVDPVYIPASPTCTIERVSGSIVTPENALTSVRLVTNGDVSDFSLNGVVGEKNAVLSPLVDAPAGTYSVQGTVTGPGGNDTCRLDFIAPTCEHVVMNVGVNAVTQVPELATKTHLRGPVDQISIDGFTIPLPLSSTLEHVNEQIGFQAGSHTTTATLVNLFGDVATCSAPYDQSVNLTLAADAPGFFSYNWTQGFNLGSGMNRVIVGSGVFNINHSNMLGQLASATFADDVLDLQSASSPAVNNCGTDEVVVGRAVPDATKKGSDKFKALNKLLCRKLRLWLKLESSSVEVFSKFSKTTTQLCPDGTVLIGNFYKNRGSPKSDEVTIRCAKIVLK